MTKKKKFDSDNAGIRTLAPLSLPRDLKIMVTSGEDESDDNDGHEDIVSTMSVLLSLTFSRFRRRTVYLSIPRRSESFLNDEILWLVMPGREDFLGSLADRRLRRKSFERDATCGHFHEYPHATLIRGS